MPFPFTFDGETYTRQDFQTPGYAAKFPRFMQAMLAEESQPRFEDTTSTPLNFSSPSPVIITTAGGMFPIGETFIAYHEPTGSYRYYVVAAKSGNDLTVSPLLLLPSKGTDTYTDLLLIKALPPNPTPEPYVNDLSLSTYRFGREDFLGFYPTYTGGNYPGSGDPTGTTLVSSNFDLHPVMCDLVVPNGFSAKAESAILSGYPGRGWFRFMSAFQYSGAYFGSLTKTTWSQVCLHPEPLTNSVFVGWQGYPASGTPANPIGFPHELLSGRAAFGPYIEFTTNSIRVGWGDSPTSAIATGSLPGWRTSPVSVEIKKVLSDVIYRIYTESGEVTGTFPAPATSENSSLYRPYVVGRGSYLLDYFWARSSV